MTEINYYDLNSEKHLKNSKSDSNNTLGENMTGTKLHDPQKAGNVVLLINGKKIIQGSLRLKG